MGLKPTTTKCHLVRAILESVSFRLAFLSPLFSPLAHTYLYLLTVLFFLCVSLQKYAAVWHDAQRNKHSHHQDQVRLTFLLTNSLELGSSHLDYILVYQWDQSGSFWVVIIISAIDSWQSNIRLEDVDVGQETGCNNRFLLRPHLC